MIKRYTHPDMGRIWSDQRRYETWLLVEIAAADAMASAGIVPPDAARDIRERGAFDIARIEDIERTTQHDVIAFTTAVAEKVGPSARSRTCRRRLKKMSAGDSASSPRRWPRR